MVGLGKKLVGRVQFSRVLDSAQNDNRRANAVCGVFEGLGCDGRITMIAVGVKENQVGPMLVGKLSRFVGATRFDGGGSVKCKKRAENFARFGGFVDNQHS